jgi:hypothetical protein
MTKLHWNHDDCLKNDTANITYVSLVYIREGNKIIRIYLMFCVRDMKFNKKLCRKTPALQIYALWWTIKQYMLLVYCSCM